jgi:hypothetical protein
MYSIWSNIATERTYNDEACPDTARWIANFELGTFMLGQYLSGDVEKLPDGRSDYFACGGVVGFGSAFDRWA